MKSRKRLLEIAIWNTIQSTIKTHNYDNISESMYWICNEKEKNTINTCLNETDRQVIESILSDIARLLNI